MIMNLYRNLHEYNCMIEQNKTTCEFRHNMAKVYYETLQKYSSSIKPFHKVLDNLMEKLINLDINNPQEISSIAILCDNVAEKIIEVQQEKKNFGSVLELFFAANPQHGALNLQQYYELFNSTNSKEIIQELNDIKEDLQIASHVADTICQIEGFKKDNIIKLKNFYNINHNHLSTNMERLYVGLNKVNGSQVLNQLNMIKEELSYAIKMNDAITNIEIYRKNKSNELKEFYKNNPYHPTSTSALCTMYEDLSNENAITRYQLLEELFEELRNAVKDYEDKKARIKENWIKVGKIVWTILKWSAMAIGAVFVACWWIFSSIISKKDD